MPRKTRSKRRRDARDFSVGLGNRAAIGIQLALEPMNLLRRDGQGTKQALVRQQKIAVRVVGSFASFASAKEIHLSQRSSTLPPHPSRLLPRKSLGGRRESDTAGPRESAQEIEPIARGNAGEFGVRGEKLQLGVFRHTSFTLTVLRRSRHCIMADAQL